MSVHSAVEWGVGLPVPLTTFVGRESLIATVCDLLRREEVRLLTLTGTGGVGKTRLALRVVEAVAADFPDGVVFVPLAPVEAPELVGATIGRVLGVPGPDDVPVVLRLAALFAERRVLLVLDNFEHVVAAAPLVTELLAACPALKVLVTSRALLRVSGERTLAVPPLGVPEPGDEPGPQRAPADPTALLQAEAVRLFVDRARAVRAGFPAGAAEASLIAAICRRLDGLPLAIELAAARITILPPAALLSRLERRLPLLTGGARDLPTRQQTMRNAVAWSHDLLGPAEQALFRRLAVFVGGATLEHAEAVASAAGDLGIDLLDGLASLVGSSLLQQDESGGEPRFTMLETLREFALEQLAASGEEVATRDGHAAALLRFAERAEPELSGPDQVAWVERIETELGNLRAALTWLQERGAVEAALRLAAALSWIWALAGLCREGLDRLTALTAMPGADEAPAPLASVVAAAANLADILGQPRLAWSLYEEALARFRALGDRQRVAGMLRGLASVAVDLDEPERAAGLLTEADEIARESGAAWEAAAVAHLLGVVALTRGDAAEAIGHHEAALAGWREIGGPAHVVKALLAIGLSALVGGDRARALDAYTQFVDLAQPLIDEWFIIEGLLGCAGLIAESDAARAARALGASVTMRERLGLLHRPVMRRFEERMIVATRATLGEEAFAAAWAAGRALSLEEAAAEVQEIVRSGGAAPVRPAASRAGPRGLTPREIDVLRLIALGRSDREIADALFISRRTASKHVESILAKLGVATRAGAASEAVRLGLA